MDDLPVAPANIRSLEEVQEITRNILSTFQEYRVPAIGFVNENRLEIEGVVDPARVALLEQWLQAGLELGNHGYAHLDLHRVRRHLGARHREGSAGPGPIARPAR
jgi:peptidoglycan/xylan/chitin deacetylase (PgdA/CDA1 family)